MYEGPTMSAAQRRALQGEADKASDRDKEQWAEHLQLDSKGVRISSYDDSKHYFRRQDGQSQ
jgi:hypothetical protein